MSSNSYNLGFISDTDIRQHVRETVLRYRNSITLKEFNSNIVDPIKLTFDAKVYKRDISEIIENECIRQIDKSNTNHIGYFHQNLFRYVGQGWSVPSSGFDLVNEEKHIFVELKNKHNTMNSGAAQTIYSRMQDKILHDDEATCMLVEVIATQSKNEKWFFSGMSHRNIRRLSIDKFYQLAFPDYPDAFCQLCKALPLILEEVLEEIGSQGIQNSVYEELRESISEDISRSLYLLAFKDYAGFDKY